MVKKFREAGRQTRGTGWEPGEGAEVNLEFSYLHASRGINKKIITEIGGKCGGWGGE